MSSGDKDGLLVVLSRQKERRYIVSPSARAVAQSQHWTDWHGETRSPIRAGQRYQVRFRNGTTSSFCYGGLWDYHRWYHNGSLDDIVAYRIVP